MKKRIIRSIAINVAIFVLSMPLYVLVLRVYAADFLIYALKSALTLTILYVPYVLMLRREHLFHLNRSVLLGILVASLLLPLLNVSSLSLDRLPVMHSTQKYLIEIGVPVMTVDDMDAYAPVVAKSSGFFFNRGWFVELGFILFCGMMGLVKHRVSEIWNMRRPIHEGALWHEERDGIHIYCHADDVAPYSWLNNIVINEKDYRENGREILLHETGHILCHHSYDILLLTLVQALQWWNPFAYMLGYSLRDVHEYQADDYVLRQGVSARDYQLLLINKAVDSSSYTFVNSFYKHSLTKNRITMMQKSNPSAWVRYKALYVIPVAAFALSAFATPKFTTSLEETIAKATGSKVTSNSRNEQVLQTENLPTVESYLAARTDSATVSRQVCFIVDGKELSYEEFAKLNSEDIASMSVLTGESAIPFFGEKAKDGAVVVQTKSYKPEEDENAVEKEENIPLPDVMPVYEGGINALYAFLSQNIKYPVEAFEAGVQGRVFVVFVVEADGSVSNAKIDRVSVNKSGEENLSSLTVVAKNKTTEESETEEAATNMARLEKLLEDEALRVIKMMPAWTPGTKDGKNVRTRLTLPVTFRLS